MVFSSPTFLFVFLPLTLLLYFGVPRVRLQNFVLLVASLLFYAWGEPWFVLVMLAIIAFDWALALAIERSAAGTRAALLSFTLVANLAVLGAFKYFDFVVRALNAMGKGLGISVEIAEPGIPLPLGISFFIFQALSYVIDVYRGKVPANRRITDVALYITMFPQLVAGPIVRYSRVASQIGIRRHTLGRISIGCRMFVIGLAQKVLVADEVGRLADIVFGYVKDPGLQDAWLGVTAYTLQIYYDFAGYSNMAIGLGFIMGFSFGRNFSMPYRSLTVTEFWRRWHISLSSWFRDYLYIPLGGNRRPGWRTYRNLCIVFALCGLWHGASWSFILWGLYHGMFLVFERAGLKTLIAHLPRLLAWAYTILAVMGGWVLFRAEDLSGAWSIYKGLLGFGGAAELSFLSRHALSPIALSALCVGIAYALSPRPLSAIMPRALLSRTMPSCVRAPGYLVGMSVLAFVAIMSVAASVFHPFLYFRF